MFQAALGNIRDFYTRMFWHWSEGQTEIGAGYVLNYSGRRYLSGANQLWIDDPNCLTFDLLKWARNFFKPHQAEWSIFVLPPAQPTLLERCYSFGAYLRWRSPLMYLAEPVARPPLPPKIQVMRVEGEKLRHFAQNVMGEAFGMDAEVSLYMVRPEHDDDPHVVHYLATYDNYPAGVATMTYSDGMAGVWNVGTRRMFRRRGVARALMAEVVAGGAAAGYGGSVLMSSSQGYGLYQKMGYQEVGQGHYIGWD